MKEVEYFFLFFSFLPFLIFCTHCVRVLCFSFGHADEREVTKGGSSCVNPQSRRGVPTPEFVASSPLFLFLMKAFQSCVYTLYTHRGMSCNFHQWLAVYILGGSHSLPSLFSFFAYSPKFGRKMLQSTAWRDRRTLRESTRYDCDQVLCTILDATQQWFIIILLTIHDILRWWSMLVLGTKSRWKSTRFSSYFFLLFLLLFFLQLFILFIVLFYIQVLSD
jgi:hypothetical protein